MMPDICFWYLPTYGTYTKIVTHIRDHKRWLYNNCQTLHGKEYQWKAFLTAHIKNCDHNKKIIPNKKSFTFISSFIQVISIPGDDDVALDNEIEVESQIGCLTALVWLLII